MQTETKYIGDLVCRDGTFLVGEPVKALFKHLHLGWMVDGWWMTILRQLIFVDGEW